MSFFWSHVKLLDYFWPWSTKMIRVFLLLLKGTILSLGLPNRVFMEFIFWTWIKDFTFISIQFCLVGTTHRSVPLKSLRYLLTLKSWFHCISYFSQRWPASLLSLCPSLLQWNKTSDRNISQVTRHPPPPSHSALWEQVFSQLCVAQTVLSSGLHFFILSTRISWEAVPDALINQCNLGLWHSQLAVPVTCFLLQRNKGNGANWKGFCPLLQLPNHPSPASV